MNREKIEKINEKYNTILSQIKSKEQIDELLQEYRQEIKRLFKGQTLTHITSISPEKMDNRKIQKSNNAANYYETEVGDWVFASSDSDKSNLYLARKANDGMIYMAKDLYIYGGDNFEIKGNNVYLKEPNYVYEIDSQKFEPVVGIIRKKNNELTVDFSEEWISEEEVDIDDKEQVKDIRKICDITSIIKEYQIFCDKNKNRIAIKIKHSKSLEEIKQKFRRYIKNGDLRYINGEAGINVSYFFEQARIEGIQQNSKPVSDELCQ